MKIVATGEAREGERGRERLDEENKNVPAAQSVWMSSAPFPAATQGKPREQLFRQQQLRNSVPNSPCEPALVSQLRSLSWHQLLTYKLWWHEKLTCGLARECVCGKAKRGTSPHLPVPPGKDAEFYSEVEAC